MDEKEFKKEARRLAEELTSIEFTKKNAKFMQELEEDLKKSIEHREEIDKWLEERNKMSYKIKESLKEFFSKYYLFIILGVIIAYIIFDEVTMEEPKVTNPSILCRTTQDC